MRASARALREARALVQAAQFLTRLPMPAVRYEPGWLPVAAGYFPLVGAGIGALAAAALLGADRLWGGAVPAVAAVGVALLVTGALHEDGLADGCDGLGGGTREARLEIMKDSRLGTYGALALLLCLAARIAALAAMPATLAAAALVAAGAGSRLAAPPLMRWTPYAGDPAAAKVASARPSLGRVALAGAFGLAPFALLPLPNALAAAALAAVAGGAVAALLVRGLGGHTGDVLGAATATAETAALLGAAIGAGRA